LPVRVKAKPPGEFIRDHMVDVGGVEYVQAIHRAYKKYLKDQGLANCSCRETMSKYIWLARKLGLIVFDHAEAPAYWDAVVEGVRVPANYQPGGRPRAPSPRHYYRIVSPDSDRWLRLEASYRESIGIPVPPPFPRVPYVPPPPVEEVTPAPPPPKKKKRRAPAKSKAKKVTKPTPAQTAEELAAPFEARMQDISNSLDQLAENPNFELFGSIAEEMLNLGEDVVGEVEGKRGVVRARLVGISDIMRKALGDYELVRTALRAYAQEPLAARRATAEQALMSAIRVVKEDLTGELEGA
jgi:hypothetical protein